MRVFIVTITVRLKLHLFLLFFRSTKSFICINGGESLNYLQSMIEYVDGNI